MTDTGSKRQARYREKGVTVTVTLRDPEAIANFHAACESFGGPTAALTAAFKTCGLRAPAKRKPKQ